MKERIREIFTLQDLIDQFFCAKVNGGIYISKFPMKSGDPIDTLEKAKIFSEIREFHYSVLEIREHLIFMVSPERHPGSVLLKLAHDTPVTYLLTMMFDGYYRIIPTVPMDIIEIARREAQIFVNTDPTPSTFNRRRHGKGN
jgi:hypothetical protein